MNDAHEIRTAREARPFGRFTIVLDDGRYLGVEEPYQIGISPGGNEITYAARKTGFEHVPTQRIVKVLPGIVSAA